MIIMCQCRFVDSNKCTILTENVDSGKSYARVRIGVYEDSALGAQFCCEPKTTLFKNIHTYMYILFIYLVMLGLS